MSETLTKSETIPSAKDLKVKIFADGANLKTMIEQKNSGIVQGFTTNPTLMKVGGVTDYEAFAKEALQNIPDLPISFEVFSDEFDDMERQAKKIASWGNNVTVKIPISNTKDESSIPLIKKLNDLGLPLNVTAILTLKQVEDLAKVLNPDVQNIVSVFAGRIADTGRDPIPYMIESLNMLKDKPKSELLWASSREVLNVIQAEQVGCHIITVTDGIIKKLSKLNMDLGELSLDTVKMFYKDACEVGYKL